MVLLDPILYAVKIFLAWALVEYLRQLTMRELVFAFVLSALLYFILLMVSDNCVFPE